MQELSKLVNDHFILIGKFNLSTLNGTNEFYLRIFN